MQWAEGANGFESRISVFKFKLAVERGWNLHFCANMGIAHAHVSVRDCSCLLYNFVHYYLSHRYLFFNSHTPSNHILTGGNEVHRKDTICKCVGLIMSYGLSSLKSFQVRVTSPPHRKDTLCIGLIMSYGVSLLPLCDDDRANPQMGGVLWFDVFRPYYGLLCGIVGLILLVCLT